MGAALAAAKTAKAIDRFVDLIRAVIRAGKLKTAVAVERITTKTKDTVQRIKDLTTKLVEKLKAAPKSKLSQKDIDAIGDYTEEDLGPLGYKQLNAALREGNADATQQAKINDIDTALSKLPNYDGVVYRGTDLPADVIAKYKPGEVITEDAFVSTSRNSSGSFPGNVQFEIASKTGKDIEQYSRIPNAADEAEVLFRPGSKFYVVDNYVDSSGKTIIKMAER
ncbi:ADP-ribosyltransferase [Nocardia sp. No.11]|uniref:ADP-ribosyltransferase n=1 Tax=Nocardia sp. No.11 TaxID=3128861 RepID=UPI001C4E51B5